MINVISFGGGVQSTSLLVLAAEGKIDFKTFLFCNVGDDSENPETIRYVHDVAMPYAQEHGIEIIELQKVLRTGEVDTLYQRITKEGSRSIPIPVRVSNGAPGNRSCTADFKIKVVDRWLKEHALRPAILIEKQLSHYIRAMKHDLELSERYDAPYHDYWAKLPRPLAQVGLGISLDEFQRVKPNMDPSTKEWKENVFPLIDLRMDRQDCINVIQRAGLPVPPKSSCFFCPFHRLSVWQEMRQKQPDLFWKSAALEQTINERREMLGKDKVWFTRKLIPLALATTEMVQGSLFEDEDEVCDSGYCFM